LDGQRCGSGKSRNAPLNRKLETNWGNIRGWLGSKAGPAENVRKTMNFNVVMKKKSADRYFP
jgi:hypothetical protein